MLLKDIGVRVDVVFGCWKGVLLRSGVIGGWVGVFAVAVGFPGCFGVCVLWRGLGIGVLCLGGFSGGAWCRQWWVALRS